MNFASYDFWKLLFLCFLGSRLILSIVAKLSPQCSSSSAKLCLLATGLILMGSESWLTLGMFLWVVLLGWICVLLQDKAFPKLVKNLLFGVLLLAQIAPLFYYKYWNFVLNDLLGWDMKNPSVLIPMGLSFYTFQTIGFWVDNLRQPSPRPTFLDYLNFSSFFPQIVAGPIEKREDLLPQIENNSFRILPTEWKPALTWIILGLGYKMIVADNLGSLSDQFLVDSSNAWHVWLQCFVFSFRIYFDFAGYSFIAVGLGLLFGVTLTLNFRCPYWSRDLRVFWRNWHVTLGTWLRDYIYFPLGGSRVKWWALNILITFLVSGIWHGAGWGFVIWGLLHGIGVGISGMRKNFLHFAALQWAVTFIYCSACWLFFFERDTDSLCRKALSMVQPSAYRWENLIQLQSMFPNPSNTITTAFVLLIASIALALEGLGVRKKTEPYALLRYNPACIVIVFLIVLLAPMEESRFIYFNF